MSMASTFGSRCKCSPAEFRSKTAETQRKDDRRLAAKVDITMKLPALVLEDIDHHLRDVTCSESFVVVGFITTSAKQAMMKELANWESFHVITSHGTCNEDGARTVYLVSSFSTKSELDLDLVLSVTPMPWKKSIQTIRIDFAQSDERYHIQRQDVIAKRQALSSSEAAVVVGTPTASATVPVAFPSPPTTSPTATSVHKDLSFSYIDTPLLPPSFPGVDSTTLKAPIPNPGVSFRCKNCTLTGTIDISQGSISGNANTSGSNNDENEGFSWNRGSFIFEMNDFSAHMELGATVQPSLSLLTYNALMPSIGLPGFQIPGIGIVGPIFTPNIEVGTEISTQLDFTYGFDLTVPDNSSITLNLVNSDKSTITGFPDTKITALPFTSGVDNIALTVSAAFRPELLLGVEVLTGTVGAGIFFNLPTVAATITQVAHVNSKCEPVPANQTSSTVNGLVEDVFGGLTHIEPSVEFNFGVLAEAEVNKDFGVENVHTVFNTSFPLPTACLEFNRDKMALGLVTPSVQGKAVAVASGIGAAGKGRGNPLESLTGPPLAILLDTDNGIAVREYLGLERSDTEGKMQIPGVLRGEIPASYDADNIGTKNYSRAPAAVLLGGAYEESDILEMREACKNDSKALAATRYKQACTTKWARVCEGDREAD
ncbi:MAG: hypothetical protein Q9213_005135 [Squamulea squamosa]